ncbi:MAG TPA: preprotein translocase subunit SecE [Planctomycetaceae bacterium]|nr:preprotein translocase subunit SecE [Planctomycetaceae bacterium]
MSAFLQELLRAGIYKRSQGRISRQVTFATVAIVIALGVFALSETLRQYGPIWQYALPFALLFAGWWATYRLVNVPAFADFLIAVEAEMNKVSWPSRHELIRGSAVVLITIVLLATLLFGFDAIWSVIFKWIGVR